MNQEQQQKLDDAVKGLAEMRAEIKDLYIQLRSVLSPKGIFNIDNLPGDPTIGKTGALAMVAAVLKLFNGSAWVPVGFTGGSRYATYAAGTAYSLTTSYALLDFGTTDPQITIAVAGTYLLLARVRVQYNAATFAAVRTASFKLRKSSGTPADVTNAATTIETGIVTTITSALGTVCLAPAFYVATAGDVIDLQGLISVAPSAGSLDCVEAEIVALRIA